MFSWMSMNECYYVFALSIHFEEQFNFDLYEKIN